MLQAYGWTDTTANRDFNLTCQGKIGGFSKECGVHADVLHAYMGYVGFSGSD